MLFPDGRPGTGGLPTVACSVSGPDAPILRVILVGEPEELACRAISGWFWRNKGSGWWARRMHWWAGRCPWGDPTPPPDVGGASGNWRWLRRWPSGSSPCCGPPSRRSVARPYQAAPVIHGPGALSYHVGSSGALEVSAGSTDALRVVPAGFGRGTISPLESSAKAAPGVAATYDHGALSVWYSHRGDALDQGFTVTRRPSGTANKVVIAMNTSGALHPELDSLTSLTFEGSKVPAIAYSSLKVTDATGRVLPARLGVSGTSVSIMFKDRDAVYPVRIDPWIQQSLLTPPAGAEAFGSAIATSSNGTTVLVGDPYGGTSTGRPPCTPRVADRGPRAWR